MLASHVHRAVLERLLPSLVSAGQGQVLMAPCAASISSTSTSDVSSSTEPSAVGMDSHPSTSTPAQPIEGNQRKRHVTKREFLQSKGPHASHEQLLREHQEAASYHGSVQKHAETLHILRRHNYSLPALRGQVILARILRISNQRVFVDPGFHSITEVPRADLDVSHVQEAAPGQALEARESTNDLRVGDVVCVRIDAPYTPYGDMQVEAVRQDPALKKLALWRELEAAWRTKQPVFGRVLNQCPGGYAVGISGFVALLPYARATTAAIMRIGELHPFFIDTLNEQQQMLVVRDSMLQQRRR
ncbi:hypothetical protein DUNSADRAFT_195 [Dunaliella salina]|uniref:S1 motif domain-containing protein n=1 Tax=Dunaliella salina TaxID=3046 RepID=A0ABQ7FZC3_DUNSA|nr:hypothetical protein DUNSADRAFT_195 [Dunaliella salina]|eukprot:KAF5827698.1 hypothetical protein DUNSADRAFT_195 [Dunaliella salina]